MKINEIIRKKRIEKGYTQEQLASFLGVSAPAVNKWEKAISYPDITLLPALARLLDTDLNTLLSFQEDLTQEEIRDFVNELAIVAESEGIDSAFSMALDKLHEYPSCDVLLLNVALTLEGLNIMSQGDNQNNPYMDDIEEMYVRASESCNPQVSCHAKSMLISKCINRKEFDTARKLIDELPEAAIYDKKQLEANLCRAEGDWAHAAQIIEQKILSKISNIQSSLYTLIEIAVRGNHLSDAEQLAGVAKETVRLFDLWECNTYIVDFLLATARKDADRCLSALEKMLPALNKGWKPAHSPLYRHIPVKETDIGQMMRHVILKEVEDLEDPAYDFLRDKPEIKKILAKYNGA